MWYKLAKLNNFKINKSVATCIIFRKVNDKIQVLLVKRKYYPNKNEWCIPGGHLEKNEKAENAIIREIEEETSLSLNKKDLVKYKKNSSNNLINEIFVTILRSNQRIKAGTDASDAKWHDVDDLPELIWNNKKLILESLNGKINHN